MADHQDAGPSPSARRARAPTITIDTTAVSSSSNVPDMHDDGTGVPVRTTSPASVSDVASHTTEPGTSSQQQPTQRSPQLQTTPSFDRETRPTSPHNVSSPVLARGDRTQGFLAVPIPGRSRQNSLESEDDGAHSVAVSQGDTVIGSSSYGGSTNGNQRSMSAVTESDRIMNDENALKPDLGKEADFEVEDNPFAFSTGQLNKMFDPKSLPAFWKMGGLRGLERGLRSDIKSGLSMEETTLAGRVSFEAATENSGKKGDQIVIGGESAASAGGHGGHGHGHGHGDGKFVDRKRIYSDNRLPERKAKSLLQLVWITFNDKILIMLSIAAVVSLAVGLYQTFGQTHDAAHPRVDWVEGVAIVVAIVIVVVVGSLNDWQKERQFAKLNRKKTDRLVKVVRSGKLQEISVFDVLVGDVMQLETGDMIPVDGVLIEGHNIKCDESQATGESDLIRKRAAGDVYAAIENHESVKKLDPFIQSGARVMEGLGTFLVTSTGVNSTYGKTMMSLQDDPEITPLQMKLNVIADYIAKLGGAAAVLLFVVLFIEFLVRLPKMGPDVTGAEKGQDFIKIFIVVITIIVVAVPEGLPLAVTLALSYATAKMVKENNLVRHLKACEVMGNASTICSDKTGTLTQNRMRVVAGSIGTTHRFGGVSLGDVDGEGNVASSGDDDGVKNPQKGQATAGVTNTQELSAQELTSSLNEEVRDLLLKSITLNSTAFEGEVNGRPEYIGSKTESALLTFARDHLAMGPVAEERANGPSTLQLVPFDSGRKCMGIVVERPGGGARLLVKGASEIMVAHCTQILRDPARSMTLSPLTEDNVETLNALIENYASSSLRTIGIIYRDFEQWPPRNARRNDSDDVVFDDIFTDMVFLGIVGIKDPLREGVREAVQDCQRAGVVVRMVTGDNRLTAQAIAADCGILQPNSIVIEGPVFRNMSKEEQVEIIPRLHVMARSSPDDKRVLVQRLKELGETVAVTGDGTNDAPALKLADVGFSMGISGTEVAKEASAIILMDDNFTSIVVALKWGRAVNDAVKRFLQFQLTVNVTAVVLTFVSAVSSSDESSVLTAVQLLWVNLIMDTLAALALATDPPHPSVLDRRPERKGASIISTQMWKMIVGQAIYQLVITFMLYFGGKKILPNYDQDADDDQVQTLVFNTFVWMQIFNQWNNRRLDNRFNIFEGLTKNWFFIGISAIMIGGQVLIIKVGGLAFNIAGNGQTPTMWGYAIAFGAISLPVGVAVRLFPDTLAERLVPDWIKKIFRSRKKPVTISDEEFNERFSAYPEPLSDVKDELAWLKRVKGGRLNNLKFAIKHPRETLTAMPRKSPSHSRTPSRAESVHLQPVTPPRENSPAPGTSAGGHLTPGGLSPAPSPSPDSRSRSRSMRSMRSRSNSALGAPTVMAGIIAGSVAVGWSPIDRSNSNASHADAADFGSSSLAPSPRPSASREASSISAPILREEPDEEPTKK